MAADSVSALEAVAHRVTMNGSAERSDSESMKQIRMINQVMQKKFTSNYSPDRSLDASSSLKDFSMGVDINANNSNDYNHNQHMNINI